MKKSWSLRDQNVSLRRPALNWDCERASERTSSRSDSSPPTPCIITLAAPTVPVQVDLPVFPFISWGPCATTCQHWTKPLGVSLFINYTLLSCKFGFKVVDFKHQNIVLVNSLLFFSFLSACKYNGLLYNNQIASLIFLRFPVGSSASTEILDIVWAKVCTGSSKLPASAF